MIARIKSFGVANAIGTVVIVGTVTLVIGFLVFTIVRIIVGCFVLNSAGCDS